MQHGDLDGSVLPGFLVHRAMPVILLNSHRVTFIGNAALLAPNR